MPVEVKNGPGGQEDIRATKIMLNKLGSPFGWMMHVNLFSNVTNDIVANLKALEKKSCRINFVFIRRRIEMIIAEHEREISPKAEAAPSKFCRSF